MWWVKENKDQSRGGFQNRDIGRSDFDDDYGPQYGIDYARFSDPPDLLRDGKLMHEVKGFLTREYPQFAIDVSVRNGFVVLKGFVEDNELRGQIIESVHIIEGVREVINQLSYQPH